MDDATMLAAGGFACDGLLLFAYPLHPAGQPEKLRDALCQRDLMERVLKSVTTGWDMRWLEGADHSLRGEARMARMAGAGQRWVGSLHRP